MDLTGYVYMASRDPSPDLSIRAPPDDPIILEGDRSDHSKGELVRDDKQYNSAAESVCSESSKDPKEQYLFLLNIMWYT